MFAARNAAYYGHVNAGPHRFQQPVLAAPPYPGRCDGDPGHLGGGEKQVNDGVAEQHQRDNALLLVGGACISQVRQELLLSLRNVRTGTGMAAHAPSMRTVR